MSLRSANGGEATSSRCMGAMHWRQYMTKSLLRRFTPRNDKFYCIGHLNQKPVPMRFWFGDDQEMQVGMAVVKNTVVDIWRNMDGLIRLHGLYISVYLECGSAG